MNETAAEVLREDTKCRGVKPDGRFLYGVGVADEDDFITEEDVASGFLEFAYGMDFGFMAEKHSTSVTMQAAIKDLPQNVVDLIVAALRVVDMDYYLDTTWAESAKEAPDELAFSAWRTFHPRDNNSPEWRRSAGEAA